MGDGERVLFQDETDYRGSYSHTQIQQSVPRGCSFFMVTGQDAGQVGVPYVPASIAALPFNSHP